MVGAVLSKMGLCMMAGGLFGAWQNSAAAGFFMVIVLVVFSMSLDCVIDALHRLEGKV